MSSLGSFDQDFDTQIVSLESEWRQVYEASIVARSDYQSLAASKAASAKNLDAARRKLDRAEALKAQILSKIERFEDHVLGWK